MSLVLRAKILLYGLSLFPAALALGFSGRLRPLLGHVLVVLSVVLTGFFMNFFRDPERSGPRGESLLISPADGVVQSIQELGPEVLGVPGTCVTIFLNVFDVHVQRVPCPATVKAVRRIDGLYKAAFAKDVGHKNHRVEMDLETARGPVRVSQIAGLIARRIINENSPGARLEQGNRYGMIILGSCVQIFYPATAGTEVKPGQRVAGGSTVLARYPGADS